MKFSKQFSMYESDHTQFINALRQQAPGLEERQRQGRSLLWDKEPTPLSEQDRVKASTVKQQAYVYQNKL
ncbi:MAG: DUF3460 family protein [Burkholderiaceae bacterium]|nr:DUF3460 family protein [Burkholderiaceae bacterium]